MECPHTPQEWNSGRAYAWTESLSMGYPWPSWGKKEEEGRKFSLSAQHTEYQNGVAFTLRKEAASVISCIHLDQHVWTTT